jgi:hypothetical protein
MNTKNVAPPKPFEKSFLVRLTLWLLIALSISFVLLCVIGGFRAYTAVPLGDMWDGYIDFFIHILDGNYSILWSQHNEHRIIISRLLFWIDISIFKGMSIFLLAINYILGGLIFYCFLKILKNVFPKNEDKLLLHGFALFILSLTFSWIQRENFVWAFQSQFFLVFLLPLAALYCLYLSFKNKNDTKLFLCACAAGIASSGAMVNGVFIMPLMAVLAFFFRMNWAKTLLLSVLSVIVLCLYFHGYSSISYHASPLDTLIHHPIGFIKYVLLYLGGPFYYLCNNEFLTTVAGAFFIISWLCFAYYCFRNFTQFPLQLILLVFMFYIALTIAATAGGRLGISAATTSRYMTPALMAWSTLSIVYISMLRKTGRYITLPILILILVFLFPYQLRALIPETQNIFEQKVAALALQMKVKDRQQISLVYANTDRALHLAKKAMEKNLCIFATPLFKNIGQPAESTSKDQLHALGHLDNISPIEGDPSHIKIQGWLYEPKTQKIPSLIQILDQNNKIVGYAYTGKPRRDLEKAVSSKAHRAGFTGYLLSEQIGEETILRGIDPDCSVTVHIPR